MPIDPTRREILQGVAGGGLVANSGALAASGNPLNEHAGEYNVGTRSDAGRQEAEDQADEVIRVLRLESEQIVVGVYDSESVSELRDHPDIEFVEENESISIPEPPEEGPPDGEEAEQVEEEEGVTVRDEEEAREDGTPVEDEDEAEPELLTGRYTYAAERISVPEAHELGERGEGAHIAIIDTGIESTHSDLEENLGEGLAITECLEADCNKPWDDANTHGTWVAGVAAAAGNEITGVAPEATIHAVRAGKENDSGEFRFPQHQLAEGVIWATDQGYDIVNLSLGSQGLLSPTLDSAIQYAYNNGVLVISSAGNDGPCTDCVGTPGAGSTEIAVGASGLLSQLASFSSTGDEIELLAPGRSVRTTNNGSPFRIWWGWGTSIAAPFVSGVAALLMSNGFSNEETRVRLQETATDVGLSDNEQGYGRVNALAVFDDPLVRTDLVDDVENESATLRGELVYPGSEGSPAVFFQYRDQGNEEWNRTAPESHDERVELDVTVEDLEPDTDYEYRVAASTDENVDDVFDIGDVQRFSTPAEDTDGNGPYLLAFITDDEADRSDYRFVAEGEIDPVEDGYESPSGNKVRSVSNFTIESETDDTWVAEGHTGNGYGDLFQVHGPVANVTVDDEDAMWVELDQEEYDAGDVRDETGAESSLIAFVTESDAGEAAYNIAAEGEIQPVESGYDSPSGNEVRSVSNYEIDHEAGDTWVARGDTANGFGDAYRVYGPVSHMRIDSPDEMWVEENRNERDPDEIIDTDPEFSRIAFITETDSGRADYEFSADGEIVPAEVGYDSPSGNPVRTISNYGTEQENGTWTAEGHTGNGYGDLYRVYADVSNQTLIDAIERPTVMWVEVDEEPLDPPDEDIEAVRPEVDITVEPDTLVLFEADIHDEIDPSAVEWDFGEGPTGIPVFSAMINSYLQGNYTDHAVTADRFETAGTHEVTATVPEGSNYEGSVTWTIHVADDGMASPTIENMGTDPAADEEVGVEDSVEFSVTANDPEGNLDHVIWQETDNLVTIPDVSDFDGDETASFEIPASDAFWLSRAGGYPTAAFVVSDTGLFTRDTVRGPTVRAPFEVDIVDTNDPISPGETAEITAEIENQSVGERYIEDAFQEQDIQLDVGDATSVDVVSVELGREESTEVTLSHETDADGELEVTVRSPDYNDTTTIEVLDDAPIEITITDTNAPIDMGEQLEVTADIHNPGGQETTRTIELVVPLITERADREEITVPPGETEAVTLFWGGSGMLDSYAGDDDWEAGVMEVAISVEPESGDTSVRENEDVIVRLPEGDDEVEDEDDVDEAEEEDNDDEAEVDGATDDENESDDEDEGAEDDEEESNEDGDEEDIFSSIILDLRR